MIVLARYVQERIPFRVFAIDRKTLIEAPQKVIHAMPPAPAKDWIILRPMFHALANPGHNRRGSVQVWQSGDGVLYEMCSRDNPETSAIRQNSPALTLALAIFSTGSTELNPSHGLAEKLALKSHHVAQAAHATENVLCPLRPLNFVH